MNIDITFAGIGDEPGAVVLGPDIGSGPRITSTLAGNEERELIWPIKSKSLVGTIETAASVRLELFDANDVLLLTLILFGGDICMTIPIGATKATLTNQDASPATFTFFWL